MNDVLDRRWEKFERERGPQLEKNTGASAFLLVVWEYSLVMFSPGARRSVLRDISDGNKHKSMLGVFGRFSPTIQNDVQAWTYSAHANENIVFACNRMKVQSGQ